MSKNSLNNASVRKAYIITGATSDIGRLTAFKLARRGGIVAFSRRVNVPDGRQPGRQRRSSKTGAPSEITVQISAAFVAVPN